MLFPQVLQTGTEEKGLYPSIESFQEVDITKQSDFGLYSLVRFWHIGRVNIPPKLQQVALEEWELRYSKHLLPSPTRSDWAIWMDNKIRNLQLFIELRGTLNVPFCILIHGIRLV